MISYSNDKANLFACQLNKKQIIHANEFLRDNLTKTQIRIFHALMQLTIKHQSTFPSLKTLARMAMCARSTVQVAIDKLKELNIIRTEYRGYLKTLSFQMHEFYYKNRKKMASLVQNIVSMSLFFLLLSPRIKVNRYLLVKNKVDYIHQSTILESKTMSFQLTEEQFVEIRQHPTRIYDRALAIFQKKLDSGTGISNAAGYFMGIFRQEAAKSQQVVRKTQPVFKKSPKTEETKAWVRPKDGPYSVAKLEVRTNHESDFEIALKLEQALHEKPNIFSKTVADMNQKKLTAVERAQIFEIVHQGCTCRS